MLMQKSKNFL